MGNNDLSVSAHINTSRYFLFSELETVYKRSLLNLIYLTIFQSLSSWIKQDNPESKFPIIRNAIFKQVDLVKDEKKALIVCVTKEC